MAEEIKQEQAVQPQVEAPKPELVTRVSQFKPPESGKEPQVSQPDFDYKEIEQIQDPKAREYAEKAYKSFQRGFNQKFQEIAEIRKTYENKINESSNWSPEKIQSLLNNPEFVKSAQEVAKSQAPESFGGSQEDWSNLSEQEKVRFNDMKQRISYLEQQSLQSRKAQEDEHLKTKYANYHPEAIDILTAELLQGKVQATREHLWKVHDYDNGVKRAYELGREDERNAKQEKVSSGSVSGGVATPNKEVLPQEKDESNSDYFKRLFFKNVAKLKEGDMKK